MALQTKVIKQKITSVGNVRKVTKTMELISVAKMRKAVEKMHAAEQYGHYILEILVRLAAQRHLDNPLLEKNGTHGKRLVILFSSDRGLCGQYHARLDRRVRKLIEQAEGDTIDCVCVGSQAKRIAKRNGLQIVRTVTTPVESLDLKDMRTIAHFAIDKYLDHSYGRVSVIFNTFENAMSYKSVRAKILPIDEELLAELFIADLKEEIAEAKQYSYTLEPNEDEVLEELLPEMLAITLHHFMLDAAAAEHSARMVAMRRASDNASRMKESLTREYNRARQEAVTKEIIEIVNTADAV